MDLMVVLRVLIRRWTVILPVLLASLLVAYLVQSQSGPWYQADGVLVLTAPRESLSRVPPELDPVTLAQLITLEGTAETRNFTVNSLGGSNYAVETVASTAEQAIDGTAMVLDMLSSRIRASQESVGLPEGDMVELRQIDPEVLTDTLPDGRFLAGVKFFLYDPNAAVSNPYVVNASTGRLLEVGVNGDTGRASLVERVGPGVEYVVSQTARDAAPLLEVVTEGSSQDQVLAAFDELHAIMSDDLAARQDEAGVPLDDRIELEVVDAPLGVVDLSPPVGRASLGVVILGGALALFLALLTESVAVRRRQRLARMLAVVGQASSGVRSADGADRPMHSSTSTH